MTDQRLYLTIGVPIIVNIATMLLGFTMLSKRIDDLSSGVVREFDLTRKLFTGQLRRVEDVMDARLNHFRRAEVTRAARP